MTEILLTLTLFLLIFIGFLLKTIAENKTDIRKTKDFFKRHGISDKDY